MACKDGSEPSCTQAAIERSSLQEEYQVTPIKDEQAPHDGLSRRQRGSEKEQLHQRAVKANARMHQVHGTEPQRRGGTTTKQRYGHEHYVEIGTKGGEAVREKRGKEFYVEIGRRGGKRPKHHQHTTQTSAEANTSERERKSPSNEPIPKIADPL